MRLATDVLLNFNRVMPVRACSGKGLLL